MTETDQIPQLLYYVHKQCSPAWRLRPGVIPYYDLTYVAQGEAVYYRDGTPFHLQAGDAILLPPGVRRQAHTTGMECYAFNFSWQSSLTFDTVYRRADFAQQIPYFTQIGTAWQNKEPHWEMQCGAWLLLILYRLLICHARQENPHIRRIKQMLGSDLAGQRSTRQIAEALSLSHGYCCRLFAHECGMTMKEYRMRQRLERAIEILRYEQCSLDEVAVQVGFSSGGYLSRVFRRRYGVSVSEWLRQEEESYTSATR